MLRIILPFAIVFFSGLLSGLYFKDILGHFVFEPNAGHSFLKQLGDVVVGIAKILLLGALALFFWVGAYFLFVYFSQ